MNKSLVSFVALILLAAPAFAQDPRFEDASRKEPSGWGFLVSFVPQWRATGQVKQIFEASAIDLRSDELRLGLARGRRKGSDWSLTYVRRKLKSGGTVVNTHTWHCNINGCWPLDTTYTAGDHVLVQGAEISRYFNFGTIADRIQVGIVVGAGAGSISGTAVMRAYKGTFVPDGKGSYVEELQAIDQPVEAAEMFPDWMRVVTPLGRLELAAGVILTPGLKLRASGGVSFPGYHKLGITLVYLAGRNQRRTPGPR